MSSEEKPGRDAAYDWLQEDLLDELDQDYLMELGRLQVELLKLQRYIMDRRLRLAILFEGRDTAGKGGAILRFAQRLRPRNVRVVALSKPTESERGQWYFERYVKHLPDPGEIVLFDRSWYNRAVVEPVMGFCTEQEYERFMRHVVQFEDMLTEDGLLIVKLWFSINRDEQHRRIENRRVNPLKEWKLSTVDLEAQQRWESFTHYKEVMFERTSSDRCPWIVVRGNDKKQARLQSIRYVLSRVPYPDRGQPGLDLEPDPSTVARATPNGG
ncbi:Thymidylate kinase [Planctomycetes bacterium Poly30]|uniref:ADP/GDP-polyphosphate phosphotransferase n=1 Tax=Saltatorellus ferox TaxID=2528018 RepID=A0A518EYS0_9BACT|nr:Thymidylate kinase [Planctomycetes bacterium Poly30]